jgi:hypothetical protein
MIHAALLFAFLTPFVAVALIVLVLALCKASAQGDGHPAGLSESDVALCQGRQRPRRGVTVMAGACGLTPDLSSKRGRGADTPDRTTKEG